MMIDKVQDISFPTFYMAEFFLQVQNKSKEKLSAEHFEIVQRLGRFLLQEEPVLTGLEKLAQYKGANELSIFLFDMSERIGDYAPQMIYGSLPELVEDFITLFSLIMEERESVDDLRTLLELREPLEPPEQEADQLLSFYEFIEQEKTARLHIKLRSIEDEDQRKQVESFLEISREFEAGDRTYMPEALAIVKRVKDFYNLPDQDKSAAENMEQLEQLEEVFHELDQFSRQNTNFFKQAIAENKIPAMDAVELQEEPMTVDALLQEYFVSEVCDYVERFRALLKEEDKSSIIPKLIKTFRALKEISMIHGHSGIEYFITQNVKVLNNALIDERSLTDDSHLAFESIFTELQKVEHFGKKNDRQIKRINELVTALGNSLSKEAPETEEISFEDKEILFKAVRETFSALFKKIEYLLQSGAGDDGLKEIQRLLKSKGQHFSLLHPDMEKGFFIRLAEAYACALSLQDAERTSALESIGTIWEQVIRDVNKDYDFSLLDSVFSLVTPAEEFSIDSEDDIIAVFIATQRKLWDTVEEDFKTALKDKDSLAQQKVRTYFRLFLNNINLIGFSNYQSAAEYFLILAMDKDNTAYKAEQVEEIVKSYTLVLYRIEAKGKQGNANDVVEVLQEIMAEEEIASEEEKMTEIPQEAIEAETTDQDLGEDEQFFREEGFELLNAAREAITELGENPKDRGPFKIIGNALHNIRSSAHLLNKEKIVNFAVTLEETAEMFESADVPMPDELLPEMGEGISVLEKLINGEDIDVEVSEKAMANVLNRLILEEPQKTEELGEKELEEDEKAPVEDQPLFAENEDFDEELLQIFKEESEKFIATLEKENERLKNVPDDMEAFKRLDYAAHSLKSAAKMLGFREISQLTDGLEEIVEAITKKQIENSLELQDNISIAIRTIKKLRNGEKISSAFLAEVIKMIDISEKRIQDQIPKRKEDRKFVAEVFLNEAEELLEKLYNGFIELEKMPESATILAEIMRNLHTLKGSALMVRFEKIGEMAHKLEDYFQVYKRQNSMVKQEMINPAFTSLNLIQEMLKSVKEGQEEVAPKFTSKLAEIDNKLYFYQNYDSNTQVESLSIADKEEHNKSQGQRKDDESVIKINTSYLDKLINMATELVVNRTELAGHFENLKDLLANIEIGRKQIHHAKNVLDDLIDDLEVAREDGAESKTAVPEDEGEPEIQVVSDSIKELTYAIDKISNELNRLSQGFEKNIQQISNLSKNLHTDILRVRMLPVEHLFNRFPRMVRDLAGEQKKKINLTIEGNNAELDRAMIESLVDPIMHILRNAIDHGIEDGNERKKHKKNKTGNIFLRARQEKNQVLIDISDDGQGIDLEKVKEKLSQKEIVSAESVSQMTEAEILDYIFYPEFSTKDETTEVSGRGVGLDVVANQIQKLKGIIRIRTEKNMGTTFSIRVPLTLVISQAIMTRHSKTQIAIPLIAVQESLEIERRDILMDDKRKYVQVHGKLLPYITLEEILNYKEENDLPDRRPVVILHDAGVSVALGIGEITGRQEIVIKSLGDQIQNIEYIAGGTILSNGEVALILDYAAVIRLIEFQFFGNVQVSRSAGKSGIGAELQIAKSDPTINKFIEKKIIVGRKPRILVVDDSSSVRTFVGSVLEKADFATIRASDGKQAYDIIEKEIIDLIITDIEMPEMDGFELIKIMRTQKKYDDIPIVILTGRSGQKQREKGETLGANSFIGKPFKESDLLRVVSDFIEIGSE